LERGREGKRARDWGKTVRVPSKRHGLSKDGKVKDQTIEYDEGIKGGYKKFRKRRGLRGENQADRKTRSNQRNSSALRVGAKELYKKQHVCKGRDVGEKKKKKSEKEKQVDRGPFRPLAGQKNKDGGPIKKGEKMSTVGGTMEKIIFERGTR